MNLVRALPLFAVLGGLAVVAVVLGRALAQLCSIRLLQQRKPEATLGCAFLGTAALALLFGYGSHAGLPGRTAGPLALAAIAAIIAAAAWRARGVAFLFGGRPSLAGGGVAACLAVRAVVCMLPTAAGNLDLPYSDAANYMALADWLGDHGFGKKWLPDAHQPYTANVVVLQQICHRTGPIFVHALLKSVAPHSLTVWHLFPVVMAWGAALTVAGVYLLCRWAARLSRPYACLAAFVTAVGCNALDFPCTSGFLSTIYGMATAAFLTAFLAALARQRHQTRGGAFLLGVTGAMMIATYPEMSPLAFGAVAAFLLVAGRRARAGGYGRRFLLFLGGSALLLGLVANVEIYRAYRFLQRQAAVTSAGYPVKWTLPEFAAFAVGNLPTRPHVTAFLEAKHVPLLVPLFGIAAVGLGVLGWRRRLQVLLPWAVAAGIFAYFATCVADPWSKEPGHTFALFKLVQWSFPFTACAFGVGLAAVLSRFPRTAAAFAAGAVCGPLAHYSLATHLASVDQLVTAVQASLGSKAPLADLAKLRREIRRTHPPSIYFVHEPDGPWPRGFFPTLFYPRPVLSPWRDCCVLSGPWIQEDHIAEATRQTLFLTRGAPPFTPPRARLPFDFCAIDASRPLIFRVANPNGINDWGPRKGTWLGDRPVRFWCFSPRAAAAVLTFAAVAGPALPGSPQRTLEVTGPDGKVTRHTLTIVGEGAGSIPLTLPAGVSHLDLQCLDAPNPPLPPNAWILLVSILDARLAFAP